MISIEAHGIVVKSDGKAVLDGLDLAVGAGEIFFLLGPSGCGKTTLLRTLAGFHPLDEGRIFFGNEDVTAQPPHLRHAGMIFPSYTLWPHMTVEKSVALALEERQTPPGEIAGRVAEALAWVKMGPFAARRMEQLSGGQQQRVALARALVIRPRCLLLDEPLSSLEGKLRLEMRSEIRAVCRAHGLTAIYVTHERRDALAVADRLAVLEAGKIRQTGTPAELYRRPNSRFVAEFIGETNFIEGTVLSAVDGTALVETVAGKFEGRADGNSLLAGERVTVSVRPEAWTLQRAGLPVNAVAGELTETAYLGETAEHRFQSQDICLKVLELNPRPAARDPADARFAVAAAADVSILRD